MNLAEDYFSKKYFSEQIFSENFENRKADCQILFFDRVFRRHHVAQDPVNFTDPNGTGPITGGSVCAALEGANALYNTGKFIIDNNNLTNEYTDKINKLKGDGSNTCPEIEAQISQLQLDFINKQKALLQSYLTPNLGRQGLIGAACITALLSPSP